MFIIYLGGGEVIISEMLEFMLPFYLSRRDMTDVSADVTEYYV